MEFAESVIFGRLKALGNVFSPLNVLPVDCLDLKLSNKPPMAKGERSYEDLTAAGAEKL